MRILVEVHHPAHIHFFKHAVRIWRDRGDEVLVLGRQRDVMRQLLAAYDWMPAKLLTSERTNNRFPIVEMLERQSRVFLEALRFKPDVVVSLMGSYTQLSRVLRVPNIIFTDSELQSLNHRIAHPFATRIYTPDCFWKDLGPKQRKYAGYHELAFLHPNRFTPRREVLDELEVKEREYVVLRLSAFNTLHDMGKSGLGSFLNACIERLGSKYRVFVVPEGGRLPEKLQDLRLRVAPDRFHDVLAFSAFVVSEGASTAAECAMLGTPVIYINPTVHGYCRDLEQLGLMSIFTEPAPTIPLIEQWLEQEDLGELTRKKKDDMLARKIDVTDFLVKEIDALL